MRPPKILGRSCKGGGVGRNHSLRVRILAIATVDPKVAGAVFPQHGVLPVERPVLEAVDTVQVDCLVEEGVAVNTPYLVHRLSRRVGNVLAPQLGATTIGAWVELHVGGALVKG